MKTLKSMTKDERQLLLYFETCAVDQDSRVDLRHLNLDDIKIAQDWNEEGFIKFGRLTIESIQAMQSSRTHWCELSEEAWTLAHAERKARFERVNAKRCWVKTEELRSFE